MIAESDASDLIWRFSPRMMPPRSLEALLILPQSGQPGQPGQPGPGNLVERLVEQIVESSRTKNKHYRLLVAPGGMGKTHLIATVHHRLASRDDLDGLAIAWLPERGYEITSELHLFRAILEALRAPRERLERLTMMGREEALNYARMSVLDVLAGRTLLLIIEDLDVVLEVLGETGQKGLRSFLQKERCCTILASARRMPSSISDRDCPFFGFFSTQVLDEISAETSMDLLAGIAKLRGKEGQSASLQTLPFRAAVYALHHILGGRPGYFMDLPRLFECHGLEGLDMILLSRLDDLTPGYERKMQALSPQQRMMLSFLSRQRSALRVKQIAHGCFVSEQTASPQLRGLRSLNHVVGYPVGRETYYEIQDPLLGLVLDLGRGDSSYALELLRFLSTWYLGEEQHADISAKIQQAAASKAEQEVPMLIDSCEAAGTLSLLACGIVRGIVGGADPSVSSIHKELLVACAEQPALRLAVRLADVAMRCLQAKDPRILFEIPMVERRLLGSLPTGKAGFQLPSMPPTG